MTYIHSFITSYLIILYHISIIVSNVCSASVFIVFFPVNLFVSDSLLCCLVWPVGSVSQLMFPDQVCCTYHKCRSNAIFKNEDPIKRGLYKRKKWSSCMSKVKYNFQKSMLSCQDFWTYSRSWYVLKELSGW